MKNIAVLILVHTDPKHLKKLIYSLDSDYFDIFIHVDKKVDIKDFCFSEYKLKCSKMYIIQNRESVYWGDISIVIATLKMYEKALNIGNYERFITLSGLDYPIMSNEDIYNYLSNKDVEYIMGNPLGNREFHKVECFYFLKKNFMSKILNKICVYFYKCFKVTFNNKILNLKSGEKYNIYFAPQWHALSRNFVVYLFETLKKYPEILKYFRYSYAPDELLIPTILFNSPYSSRAIAKDFPNNTHYNSKCCIHFLNYSPVIEVFDETKYDLIINSKKCFLRKTTSGKSDKLIDLLDKYRTNH